MVSQLNYSVPLEAQSLLENGILKNPLMKGLPPQLELLSKHVQFEGSDKPSIPINWRFAESISALKAFEAVMLNYLLVQKYKINPVDVKINTDHASLFIMSVVIAQLVKDGTPIPINPRSEEVLRLFPSQDKHRSMASLHRTLATNIYRTKDGRYYHTHGKQDVPSTQP